jgi:hypothetical protein
VQPVCWTISSYSLLTAEKQNPTITMTAPDASFDSPEKRNKQPAVTKEHQGSEYPQAHSLDDVRLWLAKQANRTDANCDTKAADQNVNHRPSLNRAPIEATQRTVTRAMLHSWSNYVYATASRISRRDFSRPFVPSCLL